MKPTYSNISSLRKQLGSMAGICLIVALNLTLCIPAWGATSVTLQWDAATQNTDGTPISDLAGHKLHYGLSSGNYPYVMDVGPTTRVEIANLEESTTYYFAGSTYNTAGRESALSTELAWTSPDVTAPSISGPSSATLTANEAGNAILPDFRSQVTVSDNITPTANIWIQQAPAPGSVLALGTTAVTLTATDQAGNSTAINVNVTVVAPSSGEDTTAPAVTIVSPSGAGSFSTTNQMVTLAGTASDDVGVVSVRFSNNRGESGECIGTTDWSASDILLYSGANTITVTAEDAASNRTSAVLVITFNPLYPKLDEAILRAGMAVQEITIPDNLVPGSTITAQWQMLSYVPLLSAMRVTLPPGGPMTNVTINAKRSGTTDGRWHIGDRSSKVYSFECQWTVPNVPGPCRIRFLAAQQDKFAYMNGNIPGGVDTRPFGTDGKEIVRDIINTGSGPAPVSETTVTTPPWFETLAEAVLRAGGTIEAIDIADNLQGGSTVLCRWKVLSYAPIRSRIFIDLPTQQSHMAEATLVAEQDGRWHISTYQSKVYTFEYSWTVQDDPGVCRIRFVNAQADGYAWMNGNIPGGVDSRPFETDGKEIERTISTSALQEETGGQ